MATESEMVISVQPMLRRIAYAFARKFNLDHLEINQEIQLVALKAVRTHEPSKRTLVSWVHYLVCRSLYKRIKHPGFRERFRLAPDTGYWTGIPKNCFSLRSLLIEVSKEAAEVIQIAIEEGIPDRGYLEVVLYVGYGWTQEQITRVFEEVREAIE